MLNDSLLGGATRPWESGALLTQQQAVANLLPQQQDLFVELLPRISITAQMVGLCVHFCVEMCADVVVVVVLCVRACVCAACISVCVCVHTCVCLACVCVCLRAYVCVCACVCARARV